MRAVLRSLSTTETDARRLRRKNTKALQLGTEEPEHLAIERVAVDAEVVRLVKEQASVARRLTDNISSSSDGGMMSTDDDAHPAADTYAEDYYHHSDCKEKGPARKW